MAGDHLEGSVFSTKNWLMVLNILSHRTLLHLSFEGQVEGPSRRLKFLGSHYLCL